MIDLVYTWVDESIPGYRDLCARYSQHPRDLNPERFRDHYQLLRYSLRSVEMYLPWVERVLLLTCRPQVPSWLSDQVQVVHHDQVLEPQCQPTFSCNVIESYLHRLPTRSSYLLYANDDFLFGAQVAREDFLTPGGRLRVHGTLLGEQLFYRTRDGNAFPPLGLLEHTPYLIHRELWEEMLATFSVQVARTRSHRFRQDDDVRMDRLWRYFLLRYHRRRVSLVTAYELVRGSAFVKLTNRPAHLAGQLERARGRRFLCLNDDQGERPDPKAAAVVRDFLERNYPRPSRFEKL